VCKTQTPIIFAMRKKYKRRKEIIPDSLWGHYILKFKWHIETILKFIKTPVGLHFQEMSILFGVL
jgi:hypothetical protein